MTLAANHLPQSNGNDGFLVEFLCDGKFRLIQDKNYILLNTASYNLCKIIKNKHFINAIDIGCGQGQIGLCASFFYKIDNMFYLDKNRRYFYIIKKNIEVNELKNKHIILNADFFYIDKIFKKSIFDLVISNPPFHHSKKSIHSKNDSKKNAYFADGYFDIDIFLLKINKIMKPKGYLYLVIPPYLLDNAIYSLKKNNFGIFNIFFNLVNGKISNKLVYLEARKEVKSFVSIKSL